MILHVGAKYNRIVDVMNTCFGWNYKACMKGWYVLNINKATSAWFPKIADLSKGEPVPGDRWYGWCNTISPDHKYIYMNNYESPELLTREKPDKIEPHLTFVKFPGEKQYTYVGVYTPTERDPKLGWVYEKIAEDIDARDYL